jgi:hydrogenase nickel incorporation protein HypB
MCIDCGCNEIDAISIDGVKVPETSDPHFHSHGNYSHSHVNDAEHAHKHIHVIPVQQGILAKNDRIAEQNRDFFRDRGVLTLNLLSSPGAGKTALIERMAQDLPQLVGKASLFSLGRGSANAERPGGKENRPVKMSVIVGDLATDNDAQRLRKAGTTAVQITTGTACHLEAEMVAQAMQQLDWQGLNLLVIENVGNLVCPASYDLGESIRVVVLSVTEGEDKPLKYPTMFKTADVVLISKVDVTEAVGCDLDLAIENIRRVAPQAQIFHVSARTGAGLADWYQYLTQAQAIGVPAVKTTAHDAKSAFRQAQ